MKEKGFLACMWNTRSRSSLPSNDIWYLRIARIPMWRGCDILLTSPPNEWVTQNGEERKIAVVILHWVYSLNSPLNMMKNLNLKMCVFSPSLKVSFRDADLTSFIELQWMLKRYFNNLSVFWNEKFTPASTKNYAAEVPLASIASTLKN